MADSPPTAASRLPALGIPCGLLWTARGKGNGVMLAALGSATRTLTVDEVRRALADACASLPVSDRRVLVIIPDGTRTAPIPLVFELLYELLGQRVIALDY